LELLEWKPSVKWLRARGFLQPPGSGRERGYGRVP